MFPVGIELRRPGPVAGASRPTGPPENLLPRKLTLPPVNSAPTKLTSPPENKAMSKLTLPPSNPAPV